MTAESLPRALSLLEELLVELPSPLAPGRPEPLRAAMLGSIEADARRYLRREAEDECGWKPQGLELRFGFTDEEQASLPPLTLGPDVSMRGVIDRVDVDPGSGRAIVRDYKTGSVRPAWASARWAEDGQLQVALYMVAVRQLLGLDPVAGFYQPLGGDLRPRGVYQEGAPVPAGAFGTDQRPAEELDELLADAINRAVDIAAQLRTGELVPCPQTCSRYGCSFPGICRSQ